RFRFEFAGLVEQYPDIERESSGDPTFAIGGRDIVEELGDDNGSTVEASIDGRPVARGRLLATTGDVGDSEYTPGSSDRLNVGDVDLILELMKVDGRDVALVIEQVGT
ncbi:MAG TPA: hypothetical protein VGN51_19685, partial [Acidimicrobiia bacterium]